MSNNRSMDRNIHMYHSNMENSMRNHNKLNYRNDMGILNKDNLSNSFQNIHSCNMVYENV